MALRDRYKNSIATYKFIEKVRTIYNIHESNKSEQYI